MITTTKKTALLLAAILTFGAASLTSCGNADMDEAENEAGYAGDKIGNGVKNAADDLFRTPDTGRGDGDMYDKGVYDDNGVNTNEGSADGGMRTAEDNTRGAVYYTEPNTDADIAYRGEIGGQNTAADGR